MNEELRISEVGERLVGKYYRILDKGYLGLVSYHGTDQLIEAAARVSYQKGTRSINDTRTLINFLVRHNHCSPLEMPCCIFEWKAPLYVIQQLLRHRTAKLNQESHRYSEVCGDVQKTDPSEWRIQAVNNKQGSVGFLDRERDDENDGIRLSDDEFNFLNDSKEVYNKRLSLGIAREQARKDIPHSTYSKLYWQMDLRNLLHFMSLRCDSHAQLEIREYANCIAGFVKELFPITFEAWYNYDFCSVKFSLKEQILDSVISNLEIKSREEYDRYEFGDSSVDISKRELNEFWEKKNLQPPPKFSLDYFEEI